jgi:hypothetical protein
VVGQALAELEHWVGVPLRARERQEEHIPAAVAASMADALAGGDCGLHVSGVPSIWSWIDG